MLVFFIVIQFVKHLLLAVLLYRVHKDDTKFAAQPAGKTGGSSMSSLADLPSLSKFAFDDICFIFLQLYF